MNAFIAAQAAVSLSAHDLYNNYGNVTQEKLEVSFFAESGSNYFLGQTDLRAALKAPFNAWCAMLSKYVPVVVPVVEVRVYAIHLRKPIKVFEVSVALLNQYADPNLGLTGNSILRLVEENFGGWSDEDESTPTPDPVPTNELIEA